LSFQSSDTTEDSEKKQQASRRAKGRRSEKVFFLRARDSIKKFMRSRQARKQANAAKEKMSEKSLRIIGQLGGAAESLKAEKKAIY